MSSSRAFIAAGSNLGNRMEHLQKAFVFLCAQKDFVLIQAAPIYETEPVGGPKQGSFLNTLWVFETTQDPQAVLQVLQAAEKDQGRVRYEKNGPRVIDLDLAAYDEKICSLSGLQVPHERMHERWFVLKPFCDVDPHWIHPVLKKSAAQLLQMQTGGQSGVLYQTQIQALA